jgi:hypothetical protein
MKIAIMQPYFFPYIGYFSLIKHTERFILFDTVQYIRHGWIDRNRILKQKDSWLYIQVPSSNKGRDTLIKDLKINNVELWQKKILSQLTVYKKSAPYYFKVINLLNSVFEQKFETVVELNKFSLEVICDYLGINHKIEVFSEMNLKVADATAPDEWALNICKMLPEVNEYWNPVGGLTFFDKTKYDKEGINLFFQHVTLQEYDQKREMFEPGLSIIDILMFNSPDEINVMLDNYKLL